MKNPFRSPAAGAIGMACLIGLIVLNAGIFLGDYLEADVGSVADWVAAVATVGAFSAAIVAGWYAHRALTVEQARDLRRDQNDRDRDQQALRAQAERIAAWATHPSAARTNGQYERPEIDVLVRNATDLPITDVVIDMRVRIGARGALSNQGSFVTLGSITEILVPPREAPLTIPLPVGYRDVVRHLMDSHRGEHISVQVELRFTDAGGRVWVRGQDGTFFGGDTPAS